MSVALVRFKLATKPIVEAALTKLIAIVAIEAAVEPVVKVALAKSAEAIVAALVGLTLEAAVITLVAVVVVIIPKQQCPVIVEAIDQLISAARISEQYYQQYLLLH